AAHGDRRHDALQAARAGLGRRPDRQDFLPRVPARPERPRCRRLAAGPGYGGLMDLDLVAETLAGEPPYRVKQVWEWASRGTSSYAEMTNVPASARALLEERVPFS